MSLEDLFYLLIGYLPSKFLHRVLQVLLGNLVVTIHVELTEESLQLLMGEELLD